MRGVRADKIEHRAGVGMVLEEKYTSRTAWELVVVKLVEGGPAHTSHRVQVGDVLKSVDGEAVAGRPLEHVVPMIVGQEGTPVKLGLERGGQPSIVFLVRGCSKTAAYPSIGASADHYPPLFGTASQRAASAAATLQPDVRTPLRLLLDNPEPDHALVSARPASTPVRTPGGTPGEPGGSASKHGRVLFPSLDYFAGTPASPPASASKKTRAPGGGNSRGKGAAALQSLHAGEGLHTSHDRLARQHGQDAKGAQAHEHDIPFPAQSFLEQQARRLWHQRKGEMQDSSSEDEAPRIIRTSTRESQSSGLASWSSPARPRLQNTAGAEGEEGRTSFLVSYARRIWLDRKDTGSEDHEEWDGDI